MRRLQLSLPVEGRGVLAQNGHGMQQRRGEEHSGPESIRRGLPLEDPWDLERLFLRSLEEAGVVLGLRSEHLCVSALGVSGSHAHRQYPP